ncbi:MAG: 16S rRNA (guanine(527)-N(7))-methyltransferase RsmG [Pseudomonadota bacterium]
MNDPRMINLQAYTTRVNVSRETLTRIQTHFTLLKRWNPTINLVGDRDPDNWWLRHYADCIQLADHVPKSHDPIFDLGSGAGFPGLILAALIPDRPVCLVERDQRKAAFLRHAARVMQLDVQIAECDLASLDSGAITLAVARALAPLPVLLERLEPIMARDGVLLAQKGRNWQKELDDSHLSHQFTCKAWPSLVENQARILMVSNINRRTAQPD